MALRRAAALLALACACACAASYYASGRGAASSDGLRRVRFSPLDAEYLRPGASLRDYSGVIVEPVTVAWREPGTNRLDPLATRHVPPPELVDAIEGYYHESFVDGLVADGAFVVVSEPAWGVLRVRGQIVDLALSADPTPQDRARVDEYQQSFGALTLVLEVSDARSGEVLLRSVDRKQLVFGSVRVVRRNDAVVQAAAYRDFFLHQAIVLRQRLEALRREPAPMVSE